MSRKAIVNILEHLHSVNHFAMIYMQMYADCLFVITTQHIKDITMCQVSR